MLEVIKGHLVKYNIKATDDINEISACVGYVVTARATSTIYCVSTLLVVVSSPDHAYQAKVWFGDKWHHPGVLLKSAVIVAYTLTTVSSNRVHCLSRNPQTYGAMAMLWTDLKWTSDLIRCPEFQNMLTQHNCKTARVRMSPDPLPGSRGWAQDYACETSNKGHRERPRYDTLRVPNF